MKKKKKKERKSHQNVFAPIYRTRFISRARRVATIPLYKSTFPPTRIIIYLHYFGDPVHWKSSVVGPRLQTAAAGGRAISRDTAASVIVAVVVMRGSRGCVASAAGVVIVAVGRRGRGRRAPRVRRLAIRVSTSHCRMSHDDGTLSACDGA